jgi:amino-acid N-acetyltransferase
VDDACRGRGIGRALVTAATEEARRLRIIRLFALTREEQFFRQMDFRVVAKETLPHKVWTDCIGCPLQEQCDEIAMVYDLSGGPPG